MKNFTSHFSFSNLVCTLLLSCYFLFPADVLYAQYCTPTYLTTGTWAGFSACGSSGTFPLGHLITNVTIGTINNTVTAANCTNYNYAAQSTVVYDDGSCPATPMTVVVTGYSGVTVAVDLNNDFDFSDPGEIVIPNTYVAANPATYNLQLPIPPGTSVGPHRMRVYNAGANAGNATGGACDVFQFGNFHDYTIIVANNPNPIILQNTINTTICHGQSYSYGGNTYTTSQQISDTFQTATGCDSFLTINLTVAPMPVGNVNQTICDGAIFNFGGQSYSTSGTYYDTMYAATALGCDSVAILSLTVLPPAVVYSFEERICEGDSFIFAGNTYVTSGQYSDTLFSSIGCDSFITVLNLVVNPLPVINISVSPPLSTEFCVGDKVILSANNVASSNWYNITSPRMLSGQPQLNYSLPAESNSLYVIGMDENKCTGMDSINIDAKVCCELSMPTAFSPNGDAVNDIFKPVYLRTQRGFQISIYNRFGQLVFKSSRIEEGWDGRAVYSGQMMEMGTYFWHMTRTCADGELIETKGDVTLIR